MKNLMKKEDRGIRQSKGAWDSRKVDEYRTRISDESYLDHAIAKIATDLSHYLMK